MFNVKNERYPTYEESVSASSEGNKAKDISSTREFSENFTHFYSKSVMPETPESQETPATNKVVDERDDTGGWLYIEEEGGIFANLKNGNYTEDPDNEIWGEEIPSNDDDENSGGGDNGEGENPGTDPDPEDKKHSVTGGDLENFIKSGNWFEDFFSSLEEEEALELTGVLSTGKIKFDRDNTQLEKVSNITLKTDSELEDWNKISGPDADGHYTYTQA